MALNTDTTSITQYCREFMIPGTWSQIKKAHWFLDELSKTMEETGGGAIEFDMEAVSPKLEQDGSRGWSVTASLVGSNIKPSLAHKKIMHPIFLSHDDMDEIKGSQQKLTSYVKSKVGSSKTSLGNYLGKSVFSDGVAIHYTTADSGDATARDVPNFDGLAKMLLRDGAYAGIDPATYTDTNPRSVDLAAAQGALAWAEINNTGTPPIADELLDEDSPYYILWLLDHHCTLLNEGDYASDTILFPQLLWGMFRLAARANLKYGEAINDPGIPDLAKWNGRRCKLDKNCPAGKIANISMQTIKLRMVPNQEIVMDDFKDLVGTDYMFSRILAGGNMICTSRRNNGWIDTHLLAR